MSRTDRQASPCWSMGTLRRWEVIGLLVVGSFLHAGCPFEPPASPGPDVAAITTVLKYAYASSGADRKIIFFAADREAIGADLLDEATRQIQDDLGVRVLPADAADRSTLSLPALTPVDPETGEPGVEIRLGRFRVDEQGRLSVPVDIALSGLNGYSYEYVLKRHDGTWVIVDVELTGVA